MRADRLLSLLMLLQSRGRMTAQALADELEVSVRTIYRDMDALSATGVPVYADAGPGGGCALLDDYRTNLTGLNADEVRAIFMLSVPAVLADLGFGAELRAALLKLSAALPAARRQEEGWVRQRVHLDWSSWRHAAHPAPHLSTIQAAVWADRRLLLTYYRQVNGERMRFQRTVDPFAMVAKAGEWHLVCAADGQVRVFAVASLDAVLPLEEGFTRPAHFDLAGFWQGWCAAQQEQGAGLAVTLRVAPQLLADPAHVAHAGARACIASAATQAGGSSAVIQVTFESFEEARHQLLSLGGSVEVLAPLPLRLSIADYAHQIAAIYATADR